jgi:hypothetical protein
MRPPIHKLTQGRHVRFTLARLSRIVTLAPFAGHVGCGVSDLGLTLCGGLQT